MKRVMEACTPAENLESLYAQGYQHTDDFIRSGKIKDFFIHGRAGDVNSSSLPTTAADEKKPSSGQSESAPPGGGGGGS